MSIQYSQNPTDQITIDELPSPEDEEALEAEIFTDLYDGYDSLLSGYKELATRTVTIQQTSNYSGVAGPIYSGADETTRGLQRASAQMTPMTIKGTEIASSVSMASELNSSGY